MKKIILSVLIWGIIITSCQSNAMDFDTTYARILQTKIEQLRSSYNLVGISAAAYVPGQGMWLGSSGISSSDSDHLSIDMVFGAGSITKNFMASIMLQLDEADSLSLNDSVGKWLPPYTNVNGSATLRQLLDHSSGIYNVTDNPNFIAAISSDLGRFWTIEEVMTGGYVLNPYFNPGTAFRYSNTNYMLLGMIITKIMSTSLAEQFRQRFYSEYNLNESFFEINDSVKSPFAHNWADINGDGIIEDAFFLPKTSLNSSTIGAGGVISRPENLVRYLNILFGGNIISSNSLSQMLTFRPANISGANGYGLGTMRYNVSGRSCYGHGGNTWGYTSVMIYDPVDSISIAIMMNRDLNGGPVGISFLNTVIQNNPVGISAVSGEIPTNFLLHQNYPNPFNPSTVINYQLPSANFVSLKVYNTLGKEVKSLVNEKQNAGNYSVIFEGTNLSSGVYYYKLTSGNFVDVKKMFLVK